MTPLIFGKTGQVARELARVFAGNDDARFVDRGAADLTDPDACAAVIAASYADVVINAAAYTAVDNAESDEATAHLVNAAAPAAMAKAAALKNIPFLHISTDYVFDGTGDTPFKPGDATVPLGVYGKTKLAGEQSVLAAGGRSAILRTSWVFSAHGSNFVKTMLRLGADRSELNVVADQFGGPTPAAAIADALGTMAAAMVQGHAGGVFHFSGSPSVSWADFARAIMDEAGSACAVNDITTAEYPTPAKRPGNSRLDCSDLQRKFGIAQPDWRAHLKLIIEELGNVTG
ncbi:dTDP-4-dehydrorhamnose reductase [Pontixanthobacter aquaemixtae]|uniref:dTDP-4-dehydrorhamnose reductase n=1 Tax=Pontixanthobacter aquaemixtae TaxID=1958940 RepID=A0A844ZUD4_9SPHN|nr:dTDP-4-dehydrorhamnose reductase [Pontixanthobacter aquaemixtae]MXO91348.1 dTDP-4-dehydrorhamnose reductase [Pontixanthobacter aquaemixtae]